MSSGLYGTSTTANIDITELVERAETAATSAEADAVSTAADVVSTNADVASTNADVVTTTADVVSTSTNATNAATSASDASNSATYSAEWANKAEDSLVSAAAGGDQVDDYSALHWAAKAAASYAAIGTDYVSQTGETGAAEVPVGTTAQRPTPAAGQLRFNSTDSAFEGYDGTEWGALGGGGASRSIDTAQTGTLAAATTWVIDTNSVRTRALPAAPTDGDEVGFVDEDGLAATNNATIQRNGKTIAGAASDLVVNVNFGKGVLKYNDADGDWKIVP